MSFRVAFLRASVVLFALAVPWSTHGARLLSASTCDQTAAGGTRCAQPTDQIPWESPEVYVYLLVGEARPSTQVKAVWVSVDAIEPKNFVIQTDERRVGASGAEVPLLFTIAKDEWPAGRYRIDLFLDGRAERSLSFSVRKASAGGRTAGTPVAKWTPRAAPGRSSTPPAAPTAAARTNPAPSPPAGARSPVTPPGSPPLPPASRSGVPATGGSLPASATPPLAGKWVAQGPFGYLTLDFPAPGTLVLGGQPFAYTQSPTALRVLEEGVATDYLYTLREGILTLQFPQGYSLAFQPSLTTESVPWTPLQEPASTPPAPTAPPPPAESFLWGFLCTSPLQVAPGVTAIGWSEYSGAGEFTFGQDSGLPYGRVTQGGGTYRVVGETVQLSFVDGSQGAAQVISRLPDGRVSGLAYGQVVYLAGLCP